MAENLMKLQKFLIVVEYAEGQEDILESMEFVESVLEKKQIWVNFQAWENQVGSIEF